MHYITPSAFFRWSSRKEWEANSLKIRRRRVELTFSPLAAQNASKSAASSSASFAPIILSFLLYCVIQSCMLPSTKRSKHRVGPSPAQRNGKSEIEMNKRTRILEILNEKIMSWTELSEATGYSAGTLHDTLCHLIRDQLLIHPGKGSKYVLVKNIDLLEGETKGLAQRMRKQIISRLIIRMRAGEKKAEDVQKARNEFILLYTNWWNNVIEPVRRQQILEQLTTFDQADKQLYAMEDAEKMYETYYKKSEQRVRQDAEELADRLEKEKGEELKDKVASVMSRKDESGLTNFEKLLTTK